MITIADLIVSTCGASYPPPEVNPLTESDALREAQLLVLKFDAVVGVASFLFELRTALQLHETNTGVLVARGVRRLAWSGPERRTPRTAWTIGGSTVRVEGSLLRMDLGLWPSPGAQVELVAAAATFFAGDVPGLDEVPPDYVEDDEETIRSSLANWDSRIVVVSAARSTG